MGNSIFTKARRTFVGAVLSSVAVAGTAFNGVPAWGEEPTPAKVECAPDPSQHAWGWCAWVGRDSLWVHARASLDVRSGLLELVLELATDRVDQGPKGRMSVRLLNEEGQTIATYAMDEQKIGGKAPGGARFQKFVSSAQVAPEVARNTRTILVQADLTGGFVELFGVDLQRAIQLAAVFGPWLL